MKKKIIIAVVAVLILVIGGVAAFFIFFNKDDSEKEVVINYVEFPLEVQYTNIKESADRSQDLRKSVLKYTPVIKYAEGEETLALLTANKTEIQNEMRKYFMSKDREQLSKLERVQEDLSDLIVEILELEDPELINNVLFTEFIIQ